jgi:sulfate adenylyltransferase subunit 1
VAAEVAEVARWLGLPQVTALPVSALRGDNVVEPSANTGWHHGPSLLRFLETEEPASKAAGPGLRLGVQTTLRPQSAAVDPAWAEYRGHAGLVSAGAVAVGDEVVVLPQGLRTKVVAIDLAGRPLERAQAGQSVALRLADQADLARGTLISSVADAPRPSRQLDATCCWLDQEPLRVGRRVLLKHSTQTVLARVTALNGRLDLDTIRATPADQLELNAIGRLELRLAAPVLADDYSFDRSGGAFLLIDPQTAHTLAAGMVRGHTVFGRRFDLAEAEAEADPAEGGADPVEAEVDSVEADAD